MFDQKKIKMFFRLIFFSSGFGDKILDLDWIRIRLKWMNPKPQHWFVGSSPDFDSPIFALSRAVFVIQCCTCCCCCCLGSCIWWPAWGACQLCCISCTRATWRQESTHRWIIPSKFLSFYIELLISSFADPCYFGTDPDPDPRIHVYWLMDPDPHPGSGSCYFRHWPSRWTKNQFFQLFLLISFWMYIYIIFKDKSQKEVTKQ